MSKQYPYSVKYPRTANWWGRDWGLRSSWCTDAFGIGNWEYDHEHFMFKTEEDKLMFVLRWL